MSRPPRDLVRVLTDMQFDYESRQHNSYGDVVVEATVDGTRYTLEVEEYHYDAESNAIVIKTTDHVT